MDKGMRHIGCTFLLLTNAVLSQSWCPQQALWHHSYFDGNGGVVGYVRTEYTGDTLVGGFLCQRLESMVYGYDLQSQVPYTQSLGQRSTRGQGDLVENWNGVEFDTLYWFGAAPGDHWSLDTWGGGLTVLDTGMVDVSGEPLRYLTVQFDEFPTGPIQDTIIERLGFLNYYWDAQGVFLFDIGLGGLRCYSDVDINYFASVTPCDLILGVGDLQSSHQATLVPNPSSGMVTISARSIPGLARFVLTDAWGRKVHDQATGSATTFDLTGLFTGAYIYQLMDAEGRILFTGRWVKY
jgi:hypothetical protein